MSNKDKLKEIRRLLKEAYDHYFEHSDGHCKSGEGQISIHFGNYWEDKEDLTIRSVEIWSYVFGPHRNHFFDTIDEALKTVRQWHKEEMEFDYEKAAKEEQEAWDRYHKKYPEKKIEIINPNPNKKVTIKQNPTINDFLGERSQ